ncbi:hypothetical protein SUGI_0168260 [Cryptomeria japonica]|nr:hypothetical protein SUGI_0168260 [Cryptomeria japonica]
MELATTCMGYCGANLKSLCTEAAINVFHEKYPQIYTSDDKFVIDLDFVKVEKHDFLEAMSTITPATHRGATVQSRPLSPFSPSCQVTWISYGSSIPFVYRPRLLLCGKEGAGLVRLEIAFIDVYTSIT